MATGHINELSKSTSPPDENKKHPPRRGDKIAKVESAVGLAQTGVPNVTDQPLPRTLGQKAFDFLLYPLIANIGVFVLSTYVTYHSNFNQNKANPFVKRSSWFKDQLVKIPFLAENPKMARNLNMVIWSFLDGSAVAPVVAAIESRRQKISRWIDDKLGSTPQDTSVYDKEIQRSWGDVIKARATTFAFVISTYFAFSAPIFSKSAQEGILAETKAGSGIFKRETVESINGFVFDIPGKKIGGWLSELTGIRTRAQKLSHNQLKNMAERSGTIARPATATDARYQIEGIVNTGLFELVYTSLCTAGLFFLGKAFASHRKSHEHPSNDSGHVATENSAATQADTSSDAAGDKINEPEKEKWANKKLEKKRYEKSTSHSDRIEKHSNAPMQIGA